jgi:hypothetical protein
MSAAQYFDVFTGYKPVAGTLGAPDFQPAMPAAPRLVETQQRTVNVVLDSVMFTGRVPLSTWTFTIGVGDKLWVSERTSLYFGKETAIRRFIYQDKVTIAQHRINLDVGIAAYNNYGDVLKVTRTMRFYDAGDNCQPSALLQVEDNWMQLMFKFRLAREQS